MLGKRLLQKSLINNNKRLFSVMQTQFEKFDFTDKLNVNELKLKDPTNLKHMNLWETIN